MAEPAKSGTVRTETDGRIFRIVVDNVAEKNAFTPGMMAELPIGLRAMKEAALRYIEAGETMAIAAIPTIHERAMGTEGAKEGIRSFVERRPAQFQGR